MLSSRVKSEVRTSAVEGAGSGGESLDSGPWCGLEGIGFGVSPAPARRILIEGDEDATAISDENSFGVSGFTDFGIGIISARASEQRRL